MQKSVLFFFMSNLIYMLLLENLILTGLRIRGRSSQRGQPASLGNLFILIFPSTLFLQSNMQTLVLQDTLGNKTLNFGGFGPQLLTFFGLGAFSQPTGTHHLL